MRALGRALKSGSKRVRRLSGDAGRPDVVVAHSSWFRLEEQGMDEYELLSRGTGFCVRGDVTGSTHLLLSAHVAAPYRYPRYYSQEWLTFVRDIHTLHRFQTLPRGQSDWGRGSEQINFLFEVGGLGVRYHPRLDLAAITVKAQTRDEPGNPLPFFSTEAASADHNMPSILRFPQSADEEKAAQEGPLVVHGFSLHESGGESGSGEEKVQRTARHGRAAGGDPGPGRWVASTDDGPTVMGMCGGPVVGEGAAGEPVLLGMLEGLVVDAGEGVSDGTSVFVGGRELREFVNAVEATELTEAARLEEAEKQLSEGAAPRN